MENSCLLASRLGVADAASMARENDENAVRRICDLMIAGALIILTLPLMAIVALAIKLDSRGAVFYRQERVGLDGCCFMLLKFRSMIANSEPDGRPVWASEGD